jgi:pimeloyl-ACP methyl ester carboxylesterase
MAEIEGYSYKAETMNAGDFNLLIAFPSAFKASKTMDIVIEGDGYAWVDRYTPSNDPTPRNPVGLYLAQQTAAIYLARPCQYVPSPLCEPKYWGEKRFDPRVIGSYQATLDQLRARYGIEHFNLSGYSGGGYIAMVLAATRSDIRSVTTIAGLLDPAKWTKHHGISSLEIQYDPDYLQNHSKNTQFVHLCGLDDSVIPCTITEEFILDAQKQGFLNHEQVRIPADHQEIWKKSGAAVLPR